MSRRPLLSVTVLGTLASAALVLGGGLAGGAGARLLGWKVPAIPLQPDGPVLPPLMLFYGGLVVLVRSWLALRRIVDERRTADSPVTLRVALLVIAVWATPLLLGPPLASRDVFAYAALGEVAAAGLDPYAFGPIDLGDHPVVDAVDPLWRDNPTPYGPLFVALSAGIARLPGDLVTAVTAFRLASVLGVVLLAVGVTLLARQHERDPVDGVVLALANPITLLHLVSGAHNEALMVGLLALGVALGRTGLAGHPVPVGHPDRPDARREIGPPWLRRAGVVLCAVAVCVKAPAALAVVYLGWAGPGEGADVRRRIGSTIATVAGAAAVVAALGLATGFGFGGLSGLRGASDVVAYLSWTAALGTLAGAGVSALQVGEADTAFEIVRQLCTMGTVAVVGALLWRSPGLGPRALAAGLLVLAVGAPTVQPWYPIWGLALLAPLLAGERARWFVVVSVVAAFAALPAGPDLGRTVLLEHTPGAIAVAIAALVPLTLPARVLGAAGRRLRMPSLVAGDATAARALH